MYKLKMINYQPYEYEIFQDMLNTMAKQGYHTNQLSFFTIFKKTNEKSQYVVDLFSSDAQSHFNKNIDRDKFLDIYLNKDYKAIYHKKELYVFKGQNNIPTIPWNKRKNVLSKQAIRNQLMWALTCIVLTLAFLYYSMQGFSYDTFLTYGSLLIYIGFIGMFVGICYRLFTNYIYKDQFYKQLQIGKPQLSLSKLKRNYQYFHIYMIIVITIFVGGFIEDNFNAKDIEFSTHPQITLQDLSDIQNTNSTYIQKKGFFIQNYYRYFETTPDEKNLLFVEEYEYKDKLQATQLLKYLNQHPEKYSCETITKQSDDIFIGQLDGENLTVFIQKNNSLYIISSSHSLSQNDINTIIHFYN